MADDPHGFEDIYDAMGAVANDRAEAAQWVAELAAWEAAEEAVYTEFAGQLAAVGATVIEAKKAVATVMRDYADPADAPASRFSSASRRDVIIAIAQRLEETVLREWEGF
jgi:hypothetical protein